MNEFQILKEVCDRHGVSLIELIGYGRRSKMIEARSDAVITLKINGFSNPEIGVLLGNRDNSTILSLSKKSYKKLSTD